MIPVALNEWGENAVRQPGVFETAFEHSGCIDSGRLAVPEVSRLADRDRKKGCGWPISKTRYLQVLVKKLLQFVVHGDFRLLAAFLPEPDQRSLSGLEVILDLEVHSGADPAAGVGECGRARGIC